MRPLAHPSPICDDDSPVGVTCLALPASERLGLDKSHSLEVQRLSLSPEAVNPLSSFLFELVNITEMGCAHEPEAACVLDNLPREERSGRCAEWAATDLRGLNS